MSEPTITLGLSGKATWTKASSSAFSYDPFPITYPHLRIQPPSLTLYLITMDFIAGSLKKTNKCFRLPFAPLKGIKHQGPDKHSQRTLSNLPYVGDMHPPLSPLRIPGFESGDSKVPVTISKEDHVTPALWSSQVGVASPSNAPLSPVGFSCKLTTKESILDDAWSPSDIGARPSPRSTACQGPITPRSVPTNSLDGRICYPSAILPVSEISAFIRGLETTLAPSAFKASICVFDPYDIVGPHYFSPTDDGFFYCDPGAVDTLRRAMRDDPLSKDHSQTPVHLLRKLHGSSRLDLPGHVDAPFVEYLGLYYIRFPLKQYMSSQHWDGVDVNIQRKLVERYSRLGISAPFLTKIETWGIYDEGGHIPLVEIVPVSSPCNPTTPTPRAQTFTASPPKKETQWTMTSPNPIPIPLPKLAGIPAAVASFLLLVNSPNFRPTKAMKLQINGELEFAGSIVRSLKLGDPQLHDRCLKLVLEYAVGKCDVSAFVSDF